MAGHPKVAGSGLDGYVGAVLAVVSAQAVVEGEVVDHGGHGAILGQGANSI